MSRDFVWGWALRPLEHDHTPNMTIPATTPPGGVVAPLIKDGHGPTFNPPYGDGCKIWYRYYRPTERDLEILRQFFPDEDPENPEWSQVEASLLEAGYDEARLANVLTLDALDCISKEPDYKKCAVRVEKV